MFLSSDQKDSAWLKPFCCTCYCLPCFCYQIWNSRIVIKSELLIWASIIPELCDLVLVGELSFVPDRKSCSRQQWVDIQYTDTDYLKSDRTQRGQGWVQIRCVSLYLCVCARTVCNAWQIIKITWCVPMHMNNWIKTGIRQCCIVNNKKKLLFEHPSKHYRE